MPHLLVDVVNALLDLPPEKVATGQFMAFVAPRQTLEGEVFGRRFRLIGHRENADNWYAIFEVLPL